MSARLIEVIEADQLRGKGTEEDPLRVVRQYYSKVGVLLAEYDPFLNERSEDARTVGAVDPSAQPPGTLTTRDSANSFFFKEDL